jgi:hypothetical protein
LDAPPTQYRVIERGGKLIVLDARTNLPPKQAADLHPSRQFDEAPERVSADSLLQQRTSGKRKAERSGRESTAMHAPVTQSEIAPLTTKKVKIPIFVVGLIVAAILVGGLFGLILAAAAIIYVGYVALKITGPKS